MNSFRDAVAAHFKAHQGDWIDGEVLRGIGGRYAYRTRISDCRLELGMVIENRVRWHDETVKDYRISEYRYRPANLLEIAS